MTPDEVRGAIDTGIGQWWPVIQARQAAYLAAHGRYWQGLPLVSIIPADGEAVPPDNAAARPNYQAESWAAMGPLPATVRSCPRIDQYVTPEGECGYVLTVQVEIEGELWERAVHHGPEEWREHGWVRADGE